MRAAPAGMSVRDMPASPLRQIAGGFLCNAFNPRAPIYYLALFTVMLSPGLPLPTLLICGAWVMPLQWTVLMVAMLFAARHWIDGFSAAMVGLGVSVLATARD